MNDLHIRVDARDAIASKNVKVVPEIFVLCICISFGDFWGLRQDEVVPSSPEKAEREHLA